jgi:hypothetical protein
MAWLSLEQCEDTERKEPKTTICVVLCVIYNNIMHLIIILNAEIIIKIKKNDIV